MIKVVDGEPGVHQTKEEASECGQEHKKISFSSFSLIRA